jgi:MoaA/NifB/PqqE/SkfB family radical SAM enzyme
MCRHCFLWRDLNKPEDELTVDEIGKITKSMDPLLFLRMTGGEPFLRSDLPEIARLFHRNAKLRNLGINTAGYLTEEIVRSVSAILSDCGLDLEICVSIDDLKEYHDRNRGVQGSFDNAAGTLRELKKLKKTYPNLIVTTATTVMAQNQDRLGEVFEEIKKMEPDYMGAIFIRGNPKDPELKSVNVENYMRFVGKVNEYNAPKSAHSFYINSNLKNRLLSGVIRDTHLKNENQGVTCIAADKMAVLYPEGDVRMCEMLDDKIGSLKDFGLDFGKLWGSEARKSMRAGMVKRKCFCTHDCFMCASLFLDVRNLARASKRLLA